MDKTLRSQLQPNIEMFHKIILKHQPQNVPTASTAAQEQQLSRFQNGGSPLQNTAEHDIICGIMHQQNEITTMLVQQQMSSTLPQREITIFGGDPLQCTSFIRTFEHCIEEKTSSYQDCLYFLEQYSRG